MQFPELYEKNIHVCVWLNNIVTTALKRWFQVLDKTRNNVLDDHTWQSGSKDSMRLERHGCLFFQK